MSTSNPHRSRCLRPQRAPAQPLALIALAAVLAGCSAGGSETSAAKTGGATPARIVSLGGSVTEALFALGVGERVVGVDLTSEVPPSAGEIPRVGYVRQLGAEGILALSPDLVLASPDAGPPAVLEQLRAANITLVQVPGGFTVDAALAGLRAVGEATGRTAQAESLAAAFEHDLEQASLVAAQGEAPRALVIYARGPGQLFVSGRGSAGAAMLALAGAVNVAADVEGAKPLAAEALVAAAPDVIVVPRSTIDGLGGKDALFALPGMASTPAARAQRVVVIEDARLFGFGPGAGAAALELAIALRGTPAT